MKPEAMRRLMPFVTVLAALNVPICAVAAYWLLIKGHPVVATVEILLLWLNVVLVWTQRGLFGCWDGCCSCRWHKVPRWKKALSAAWLHATGSVWHPFPFPLVVRFDEKPAGEGRAN